MQIQRIESYEYRQPEPGFLFHGSSHSHWELIYSLQGTLHAVVEGHNLTLEPGQLLLCAPEQFHMFHAQENQAPCFLSLLFDAQPPAQQPPVGTVLSVGKLNATLGQIAQEALHPDIFSQDAVFHLLSLVLLQLCREFSQASATVPQARAQHGENDIIRRAQQHISAHIREKLSVTLVAKRIDVSPSYMTALFHKHLQISPGEYIRRAKLQESKRLIQEGSMNFTEIASALEYSTVHHFSRQFKEHFGITPTEYAKSVGTKGL